MRWRRRRGRQQSADCSNDAGAHWSTFRHAYAGRSTDGQAHGSADWPTDGNAYSEQPRHRFADWPTDGDADSEWPRDGYADAHGDAGNNAYTGGSCDGDGNAWRPSDVCADPLGCSYDRDWCIPHW